MKKRFSAVVTALLVCLLLLPATVRTAYAKDYDEIVSYDITVQPNTEDGSLLFVASFDWKALEELPYGQELKIGVPNGSIREEKALTDNIERLDFDNSYMYVYLTQKYKSGETFHFAYSWVQEYMYTLGSDGSVTYDYTPGWFDEARVDHMTLTWQDPAGLSGSASWYADDASCWTVENGMLVGADLPHGSQVHLTATYPSWPTELSWENSSENYPDDDWSDWGGADHYENDGAEIFAMMVMVFVVVMVIVFIVALSRDHYAGGFGTHYVFVNHLWYPAGPDGKPRPGSVGTPHKPKPPVTHHSSGGFGGGKHGGGGFGGSGFGGGSHCACASSCACACACACAGGGRAGCSAKNLYGAVRLDGELSRRLGEKDE